MTETELNRAFAIRKRLNSANDMLESLEAKMQPGAQQLDGMPRCNDIADNVGYLAVSIADLKSRIETMEDELYEVETTVRTFSNSFDDDRIMLLIQLRFLSGFTWPMVGEALGIDEKQVRRLYYSKVLGKSHKK